MSHETTQVEFNGLRMVMVPEAGGWLCATFDPDAPIRTLGLPLHRRWFRFESQARHWFFGFTGTAEKPSRENSRNLSM